MLLSHEKLVKLVERGVINAPPENISGASIDITLDKNILCEDWAPESHGPGIVDLAAKENIRTRKVTIPEIGFVLQPDHFILASSQEVFNLPCNIACEYKLKSSLARNGLNHMLAGWCDPYWSNSKLTLELQNVTIHHRLLLKAGMKIGQMVFWECDPVPHEKGYAVKGQYNNQTTVTGSKSLK